jgi:hypothetical protein
MEDTTAAPVDSPLTGHVWDTSSTSGVDETDADSTGVPYGTTGVDTSLTGHVVDTVPK